MTDTARETINGWLLTRRQTQEIEYWTDGGVSPCDCRAEVQFGHLCVWDYRTYDGEGPVLCELLHRGALRDA